MAPLERSAEGAERAPQCGKLMDKTLPYLKMKGGLEGGCGAFRTIPPSLWAMFYVAFWLRGHL